MEEDGSEWLPMPAKNVRRAGCKEGEHRIGKFFIENLKNENFPIAAVLSQVEVVRCELMGYNNTFEFIGFSEHFAPAPMAEYAPTYEVIVNTENGRVASFEFIRADG